jgi:hypothetical protein
MRCGVFLQKLLPLSHRASTGDNEFNPNFHLASDFPISLHATAPLMPDFLKFFIPNGSWPLSSQEDPADVEAL